MKKFVAAIICVVMVMMCGVAFAEQDFMDNITTMLGCERADTGEVSYLTYMTEGELVLPNNTMFGIVYADGSGFVIEYKDEEGKNHSWYNPEKNYEDACSVVMSVIGACYEGGYIECGVFHISGNETFVSIADSTIDGVCNNVEEFIKECVELEIISLW